MYRLFSILLIFFCYTSQINAQSIYTEEELNWIKNTKVVTAGIEKDYPPFDIMNQQNQLSGINKDYFDLIEKKSGLKFNYSPDSWSNLIEKLKNQQIDVLPSMSYSKERESYANFSSAYFEQQDYVFTRSNFKALNSLDDLAKLKIAIVKGYILADKLRAKYPNINLVEVDSIKEGIDKLITDKVDGYIDGYVVTNYYIETNMVREVKVNLPLNLVDNKMYFGMNKSKPILASIIEKSLNDISIEEKTSILNKWINKSKQLTTSKINFTKEELSWLNAHDEITYSGDPNWLPFEAFDKNGEYIGIVADHVKLIEELIGKKFKKIQPNSWEDTLDMIKNKKLDVVSEVISKKNTEYLNYTQAYIEAPLVLVMKKNRHSDFISDLYQLNGQKVGFVHSYAYALDIYNLYKEMAFLDVKTINEGLNKVATGELDAYVCTLNAASYSIGVLGLSNIEVIGMLPINMKLGFGINNDSTILLNIMNKALSAISQDEHLKIMANWTNTNVHQEVDYSIIWKISGLLILGLIFFYFNNRKLNSLVNEKTSELTTLLNNFDKNVIASKTNRAGIITYVSEAFCEISGYTKEELIGQKHSLIRHPDTPNELFVDMWKTITQQKVWTGEFKNRKKNGDYYWVDAVISPECDKKGKFIGYHAIRRDITDKKEIEKLSQNLELIVEKRTKELDYERNFTGSIISSAQDAVVVIDSNSIITTWNEAATKIFGYEKDEMLGHNIDIIIPANYKDMHHEGVRRVSNGVPFKLLGKGAIEITAIKKDSTVIPIDLVLNTFTINNKMYFSANIRDITDRKALTNALEDEKRFVTTLVNSQEQIVITTDGLELKTANNSFLKFFNVSDVYEFMAKYGNCICDSFDKDDTNGFIQKIMDGQKWIDYICERKNSIHKAKIIKDNEVHIFSITVDKFKFKNEELYTSVFSDITELEKTIKLNEETNLFLNQLLDSIPNPIFYKNELGVFTGFNKAYKNTFNIDEKDFIGKTVLDLEYLPQVDRVMYHEEDMNIINNLSSTKKEQDMIFADNKTHTTLYSVNAYTKEGNLPGGLIGIFTDITEQKNLEKELFNTNQLMHDSIKYASLIQNALVPTNNILSSYFTDFFTLWQPKDIVGGDIYLFEELRNGNEALLMVIDCTGHGVPGAFVTMLVKAIERQVIAKINNDLTIDVSPAWILTYFNKTIKTLLKQDSLDAPSNAGFDGGVLYYNKRENILKYSGAQMGLYYIEEDELKFIKGDKHSVGYKKSDIDFKFTDHIFEIKKGMNFYITTDGYIDQNGGKNSFPLGKKKFQEIILNNYNRPFEEQKELLVNNLKEYQGNETRNDDITVIGFKI